MYKWPTVCKQEGCQERPWLPIVMYDVVGHENTMPVGSEKYYEHYCEEHTRKFWRSGDFQYVGIFCEFRPDKIILRGNIRRNVALAAGLLVDLLNTDSGSSEHHPAQFVFGENEDVPEGAPWECICWIEGHSIPEGYLVAARKLIEEFVTDIFDATGDF